MKLLVLTLLFSFLGSLYGQSSPALEELLKKNLPENSHTDGRWVYYPDKANILELEKPHIKAFLPGYELHKVTLTNFLGYHINQGTCVVLSDSLKRRMVLMEPLWYSGISAPLLKLFLKKPFSSREELLSVLQEVHELMETGSGYRFVQTGNTDTLLTYDLVYFKGDSYTTGGNGTRSTVNYTQDGIWRQIEVRVKNNKIREYTSINPRLKDNKAYKKDEYRETIK